MEDEGGEGEQSLKLPVVLGQPWVCCRGKLFLQSQSMIFSSVSQSFPLPVSV